MRYDKRIGVEFCIHRSGTEHYIFGMAYVHKQVFVYLQENFKIMVYRSYNFFQGNKKNLSFIRYFVLYKNCILHELKQVI